MPEFVGTPDVGFWNGPVTIGEAPLVAGCELYCCEGDHVLEGGGVGRVIECVGGKPPIGVIIEYLGKWATLGFVSCGLSCEAREQSPDLGIIGPLGC